MARRSTVIGGRDFGSSGRRNGSSLTGSGAASSPSGGRASSIRAAPISSTWTRPLKRSARRPVEGDALSCQPYAFAIGEPKCSDTHVERNPPVDIGDLDARLRRRQQRGELRREQALAGAGLHEAGNGDQDDQDQTDRIEKPADGAAHQTGTASSGPFMGVVLLGRWAGLGAKRGHFSGRVAFSRGLRRQRRYEDLCALR